MPESDLRQLLNAIDAALGLIRRSNLETLSVPEIKAQLALLDARRNVVEHLQRVAATCAIWLAAAAPTPTDTPAAG